MCDLRVPHVNLACPSASCTKLCRCNEQRVANQKPWRDIRSPKSGIVNAPADQGSIGYSRLPCGYIVP